jgi:ABC-2 type transport system permease protein
MSNAVTDKRDDPSHDATAAVGAPGPSIQIEDEPTGARIAALVGAFCAVIGGVALFLGLFTQRTLPWPFTPSWSSLILHFGVLCLLFHAAYDKNIEFRRVYQLLGLGCLVAGGVLCFIPYSWTKQNPQVGGLLGVGVPLLAIGLLFLLFTMRHETEAAIRNWLQMVLLAVGVVLTAIGLLYGSLSSSFLVPLGLVLAVIGLIFLIAFVATRGLRDSAAYTAGLAVGLVGAVVFLVALGRSSPWVWIVEILVVLALAVEFGSKIGVNLGYLKEDARPFGLPLYRLRLYTWLGFLPLFLFALWVVYGSGWLLKSGGHAATSYFIPYGVLLMGVGFVYFAASYLLCSERPWVVMLRRELSSFFYSPIAYIALFGAGVFAAASFFWFLFMLAADPDLLFEPIVRSLIMYNIPAFLYTICVVPALTMRLLSEEKRSGTLEVLLTSPVDDVAVVMSNFLAALLVFLVVWAPFAVYVLALHIAAGKDFDYRPLLSFLVALTITGASFVSMGLFFSSVTRNQIISFVLTLGGMLFFTCFLFFEGAARQFDKSGVWAALLHHMNYYDVWNAGMEGKIQPQFLIFPVSLTVLWLFLSVKVLEIRKWS